MFFDIEWLSRDTGSAADRVSFAELQLSVGDLVLTKVYDTIARTVRPSARLSVLTLVDRKFKRRSKGTREPRPEAIGPQLALLGHSAPTPTLRRSQRYRGRQFVGEFRSLPRRARPFRSPAGHVMAAQRAERSRAREHPRSR